MELLTPELRQMLPPLDSQQEVSDPLVICHFFLSDANCDWYAIEFDGVDTFYGWSSFVVQEMGTFSLSELRRARGLLGMSVERDLLFTPMPLSEVKKRCPPTKSDAERPGERRHSRAKGFRRFEGRSDMK